MMFLGSRRQLRQAMVEAITRKSTESNVEGSQDGADWHEVSPQVVSSLQAYLGLSVKYPLKDTVSRATTQTTQSTKCELTASIAE